MELEAGNGAVELSVSAQGEARETWGFVKFCMLLNVPKSASERKRQQTFVSSIRTPAPGLTRQIRVSNGSRGTCCCEVGGCAADL